MPSLRENSYKNDIKWVLYNWVPVVQKIRFSYFTIVVNNKKVYSNMHPVSPLITNLKRVLWTTFDISKYNSRWKSKNAVKWFLYKKGLFEIKVKMKFNIFNM